MNQEIEGKLNDIGTELHLRPSQIERLKKAVTGLVVSTVPEERKPNYQSAYADSGFNICRTEILKKWGKA